MAPASLEQHDLPCAILFVGRCLISVRLLGRPKALEAFLKNPAECWLDQKLTSNCCLCWDSTDWREP